MIKHIPTLALAISSTAAMHGARLISSFTEDEYVATRMGSRIRIKGVEEFFIEQVDRMLHSYRKLYPIEARLHEWERIIPEMDCLIHRLAFRAISQDYRIEGEPANRDTSPSRRLCSTYLSLQLAEPDAPAPEILRRMLGAMDA